MGALYFHLDTVVGSQPGLTGTLNFTPVPGGVIPGGQATSFNYAESLAAYAQGELHLTDQLDLILGYRLTKDKKSGDYFSMLNGAPVTRSFTYKKTKNQHRRYGHRQSFTEIEVEKIGV